MKCPQLFQNVTAYNALDLEQGERKGAIFISL